MPDEVEKDMDISKFNTVINFFYFNKKILNKF